MVARENDPALQEAVIEGFRRLGLPSPEANIVVQTGSPYRAPGAPASLDLVVRCRYRRILAHTKLQDQMPWTEHHLYDGMTKRNADVLEWCIETIPGDSCAAMRVELARIRDRYHLDVAWPSGWPVIEVEQRVVDRNGRPIIGKKIAPSLAQPA